MNATKEGYLTAATAELRIVPDAVQLAAVVALAALALLPDQAVLPAAPTAAEQLVAVLHFEQGYPTVAVLHSATVALRRPAAVLVAVQAAELAAAAPELAVVQALAVAAQTG